MGLLQAIIELQRQRSNHLSLRKIGAVASQQFTRRYGTQSLAQIRIGQATPFDQVERTAELAARLWQEIIVAHQQGVDVVQVLDSTIGLELALEHVAFMMQPAALAPHTIERERGHHALAIQNRPVAPPLLDQQQSAQRAAATQLAHLIAQLALWPLGIVTDSAGQRHLDLGASMHRTLARTRPFERSHPT